MCHHKSNFLARDGGLAQRGDQPGLPHPLKGVQRGACSPQILTHLPLSDVIIWETCSYINRNKVFRNGQPCLYISRHEKCMEHTPQNACENWF